MVKISENRIAASKSKRRKGCSVTSQANSGLVHKLRKLPACSLIALYSGKYLPAWRIIHIGVYSTGCFNSDLMNVSFFSVVIVYSGVAVCVVTLISPWTAAILRIQVFCSSLGNITSSLSACSALANEP